MKQQIADYHELTKPGVTFMVIISALAGFYLASGASLNWPLLLCTLAGTWLVASGTNALNQFVERDLDRKMKRTNKRPLPSGRMKPIHALIFAAAVSIGGILLLSLAVNLLTGLLAALTLGLYVFVYTPLKRESSISTLVGAVPGAIPPMGGWTAVRGEIGLEAWVLFAILFFWQLPHFWAIAWVYRADYARGGFPMLPVIDEDGQQTGLHIVTNCLALLSVSLMPTLLGLTGGLYFFGALVLGVGFLVSGIRVAVLKSNRDARQLLLASIVYLPVLYALMGIDKVGRF